MAEEGPKKGKVGRHVSLVPAHQVPYCPRSDHRARAIRVVSAGTSCVGGEAGGSALPTDPPATSACGSPFRLVPSEPSGRANR